MSLYRHLSMSSSPGSSGANRPNRFPAAYDCSPSQMRPSLQNLRTHPPPLGLCGSRRHSRPWKRLLVLRQRSALNWGCGLSSEYTGRKAGLEFHHSQKGNAMSEGMANARILPIRPSVGFAAVSLVAGILAFLTARDANRNQEIHHLHASFAPSLLYGCVYWIWWVVVTLVLWALADRWSAAFKPSAQTVMAHLGTASVLASAHITLLQHTIWFASWHWPAWGRQDGMLYLKTLERFGVELVIYGFISGVC